jgi:hypothetical protein
VRSDCVTVRTLQIGCDYSESLLGHAGEVVISSATSAVAAAVRSTAIDL